MSRSLLSARRRVAKQPRGFTIIELLVVIVVIAILAAIALVVYNGMRDKAETAKIKSDLSQARTQLEGVKIETDEYPVNLEQAQQSGVRPSEGVRFEYTGSAESYCLSAVSAGAKQGYSVASGSGDIKEGVCEGHNPSSEPPPPPTATSCFRFWLNTSTNQYVINQYYKNQDNDPAKPACSRDVVIPSTLNGLPITTIGFNAFKGSRLTSASIPDSITRIDNYAFYGNKLATIVIPDSVTRIGSIAFGDNSNLKTASLPRGASYYEAGTTYQSFPSTTTITVR